MAKKKKSDFSKIKVKIGKSKPSNNVTKFNVKTAKVVVPGDNANKVIIKKEDESYLSNNKDDMIENLKRIELVLVEYVGKKHAIMQSQRLDLTQSVWQTYYRSKWVTPWDSLIVECDKKLGPRHAWFHGIIFNASCSEDKTVTELMVTTAGLKLKLIGDTDLEIMSRRQLIEIVKKYLKRVPRGLRQLGLELFSLIAEYSPISFWYHSRRRASIFALQTINELYEETMKIHEPLIDGRKYLKLTSTVIYSALDGRKARSIIIGEDWTQIDDIAKPPFEDLIYEMGDDMQTDEVRKVTDSKDKWDEFDLKKQVSFNLEECLSTLCHNVLDIGIKLLPLDTGCEESLDKIVYAIEILNRCCLQSGPSKQWTKFIECLLANYPYKYDEQRKEEATDAMEVEEVTEEDTVRLSKSEKKLKRQRLELASRMEELCRKSKVVKDVKAVQKLNDDVNYYIVALVHQCLVSGKVCAASVAAWVPRLVEYIASCDRTNNAAMWKWVILARQMFQLTFDRSCIDAIPLCDVFVRLCHDLFMASHPLSRIRRLSLAAFVHSCLGYATLFSGTLSYELPMVGPDLLDSLMTQIIKEHIPGHSGLESSHPTFVSKQTHYDVTLPLALYNLLLADYPGVAAAVNGADVTRTSVLKALFGVFRRDLKASEYPAADWKWKITMQEHLTHIPSKYHWDYFTFDNVSRKDAPIERLRPLCSSVASFMMK